MVTTPTMWVDTLVVGAGAAGCSAALTAANLGKSVLLLEEDRQLCGTVRKASIHTLGGVFDSDGGFLNGGIVQDLVGRLNVGGKRATRRKMGKVDVLLVDPRHYTRVVQEWIRSIGRISVCSGSRAERFVRRRRGGTIAIVTSSDGRTECVEARALIDTTGCAAAVRTLAQPEVYSDQHPSPGGWVFRVRGARAGSMRFPRGAIAVKAARAGVESGRLPRICQNIWFDTGIFPDEVFVKLLVPLPSNPVADANLRQLERECLEAETPVVDFLRGLAGLEDAYLYRSGGLGRRGGGRIEGDYVLTREDVLGLARFPDAACKCNWPIELWDNETGVALEYLPPGEYFEIPIRSLRVKGFENVWVAGKCVSADAHAQAAVRVVGTCWSMGEAAGRAACEAI